MFKIERISEDVFNVSKKFLLSVPSINEVEDDILRNAVLVFDNSSIVGCVSYELFNTVGLIRYFVFKKILSESLIKELFSTLENSAKENNVSKLFCVVNNDTIENLFTQLSFNFIDKTNLYIDEDLFLNLEYGNSDVMAKEIC